MKKQDELLTQAAWHVASDTAPRLCRTLPPRSQDVMLCLYQHPSAGGGVISDDDAATHGSSSSSIIAGWPPPARGPRLHGRWIAHILPRRVGYLGFLELTGFAGWWVAIAL